MIEAKLKNPDQRGLLVPRYSVESAEDAIAGRWRRIRRWDYDRAPTLLP